jgi:subtilisin family serine protease
MNFRACIQKIPTLVILVVLTLTSIAFGFQARVDPLLRLVSGLSKTKYHLVDKSVSVLRTSNTTYVGVLIDYEGESSNLHKLGVQTRSRVGSIWTASVPVDKLNAVANLPDVKFVEIGRRVEPLIDISVPETRATELRSGIPPSWIGYTGRGVVVGFVDTGIDLSHEDFRDAFGKSRVLFVWDQTTGPNGANHPIGYDYGTEWTKEQIDAGLCDQIDSLGHGTGVASVAVGDGSATGNGWPLYRYVGMAPEADIVMVKSTFYTDTVVDGINYIRSKAVLLGKPCVINLSIGTHFGAHDGTSLIERAIDAVSGPGVVVCTAAGNSGNPNPSKYIHAQWATPYQNSSVTAELNVTPERSNPFYVDIWYEGNDSIEITVRSPNGYNVTKQSGSTTGGYINTPDGAIWLDNSSGGTNPYNSDNECVIAVKDAVSGVWSITAVGSTINSGGISDAWIVGSNVYWSSHRTNNGSCTIPGTCISAITAGGYVTKSRWRNPDGTLQGWDSTYGEFYSISGEGPTRDGRLKPDLAVPTQVAVARSSNANLPLLNIVEDGVHVFLGGTSFAAPHVTGAVALLLQKDPTATPQEIKNYLVQTARSDVLTSNVPNTKWGFGRMDVASAFTLTPLYTDIAEARLQPSDTLVKLDNLIVTAGLDQLGDRLYVEQEDRSCGIQVRATEGVIPTEGDKVRIVGMVDIISGERAVVNSNVLCLGRGSVPKPLGMINRDVGGSDYLVVPGVSDDEGLNNIGLLIRVWGKVTCIASDCFYINDGSEMQGTSPNGIKVICPNLPKPNSIGQYAVVTGISSLELNGDVRHPVIRPRKSADLLYY